MNLPPVIVRLPDGTQTSIAAIEVPHRVGETIQSWDCSFKGLDTSDYVVGQIWGRLGAMYFLGDQVRARMDLPTTIKAILDLSGSATSACSTSWNWRTRCALSRRSWLS